jgi:hypothetical protein
MAATFSNGADDSAITLSNFWGWHFHRVLQSLRALLDEDLRVLADNIDPGLSSELPKLSASRELGLFRRSWISSKPDQFWFRWCFFDDEKRTERLLHWKGIERHKAEAFLKYLSAEEVLESFPEGTWNHITRLTNGFFKPEEHPTQFVEDWRAVYLQTPTTGSILSHLWEAVRTEKNKKVSAFIVQPLPRLNSADFPPFNYWVVFDDNYISQMKFQDPQAPIRLPASQDTALLAAEFFQVQLYQYFFRPSLLESGTSRVIDARGIEFFIFVPICLGYDEQCREWAGVLQIDLIIPKPCKCRHSENNKYCLDPALLDEKVKASLLRLSRVAQSLASDLLLAQVQELFDRTFTSIEELEAKMELSKFYVMLGPQPDLYPRTMEHLRRLRNFEIESAKSKIFLGEKQQRLSIAHQLAPTVDYIGKSFQALPPPVRKNIGGALLANIYLLWAFIDSYRSRVNRTLFGEFPYPWEDNKESPLEVYRNIGIYLGLQRAVYGADDEPAVRNAATVACRPSSKIGTPGFDRYKAMFVPIPMITPNVTIHLKHIGFAVLMILVLQQATYHTFRARILHKSLGKVSITMKPFVGDTGFAFRIENPEVRKKDRDKTSKDAQELYALANRLSQNADVLGRYAVTGPRFDHESLKGEYPCWVTTVELRLN